MKHQMTINVVDPKGHKQEVVKSGEVRLRDRFLSMLLGNSHRVLVLAPADSVESVAIREMNEKGGSLNEQSTAAVGCRQ